MSSSVYSQLDRILVSTPGISKEVNAMRWEIDYMKEDDIVTVKTSGIITWEDNKQMSREALADSIRHGTNKVLVDHRAIQPNLSVLQIDNLPEMFREIGIGPECRVAILFDPASPRSGNFTFFQHVSIIASLQFRVFSEHAEAIEWLKSDNTPDRIPAKSR